MQTIPLTKGKVALVDDDDYELVSRYRWRAVKAAKNTWYAAHNITRRHAADGRQWVTVYMHKLIMPVPDGFQIDHKNLNGLDNRRSNLRRATTGQNHINRPVSLSARLG